MRLSLPTVRARITAMLTLLRARFTEIEPLDRAFALGSRLFIAVLPLTLIAQQVSVRGTSMGTLLTSAFGLRGPGREAAETLFAPPPALGAGVGLFALLVLVFSVRGFARGLQRLYVTLWRVDLGGPTAVAAQVAWAIVLSVYLFLDITFAGARVAQGAAHPLNILASTALYAVMWAVTPSVLLARRIPLSRLVPTIGLTMVSVGVFDAVSRTYFPAIATSNAERYGLIGFAFSLFSWFFINQAVVVIAALVGAVVDEVRRGTPQVGSASPGGG